VERVFAITIAHEIGHALGLSNHESGAVMSDAPVVQGDDADWYTDYDHFNQDKLNLSSSNAINTRDVLGRDTVDINF